jgi:membrane-associated protease RseP (regulator of RpoE activity)
MFNGLLQLADGRDFIPPMNEIYHYPYLCVGWFGLFVTALNLIPVGQLDGGHILYALTGPKVQGLSARIFFGILILIGIASLIPISGLNVQLGTTGWLLWAAILYFLVKLDHPDVPDPEPLSQGRMYLGWSTMLLFILMFPPVPFFV